MKKTNVCGKIVKRRGPIACLLLFLGFGFTLFCWMAAPSREDVEAYHRLLSVSKGAHAKGKERSPYAASQHRLGVKKEILVGDASCRRHLTIRSEKSTLTFDSSAQKTKIVEALEGLGCYLQEELYYRLEDGREAVKKEGGRLLLRGGNPDDESAWVGELEKVKPMQVIQCLFAKVGHYDYSEDLLRAEGATLKRYRLEGHEFPSVIAEPPFMTATAEMVEFCLKGGGCQFNAKKLQGKLYPEEGGVR